MGTKLEVGRGVGRRQASGHGHAEEDKDVIVERLNGSQRENAIKSSFRQSRRLGPPVGKVLAPRLQHPDRDIVRSLREMKTEQKALAESQYRILKYLDSQTRKWSKQESQQQQQQQHTSQRQSRHGPHHHHHVCCHHAVCQASAADGPCPHHGASAHTATTAATLRQQPPANTSVANSLLRAEQTIQELVQEAKGTRKELHHFASRRHREAALATMYPHQPCPLDRYMRSASQPYRDQHKLAAADAASASTVTGNSAREEEVPGAQVRRRAYTGRTARADDTSNAGQGRHARSAAEGGSLQQAEVTLQRVLASRKDLEQYLATMQVAGAADTATLSSPDVAAAVARCLGGEGGGSAVAAISDGLDDVTSRAALAREVDGALRRLHAEAALRTAGIDVASISAHGRLSSSAATATSSPSPSPSPPSHRRGPGRAAGVSVHTPEKQSRHSRHHRRTTGWGRVLDRGTAARSSRIDRGYSGVGPASGGAAMASHAALPAYRTTRASRLRQQRVHQQQQHKGREGSRVGKGKQGREMLPTARQQRTSAPGETRRVRRGRGGDTPHGDGVQGEHVDWQPASRHTRSAAAAVTAAAQHAPYVSGVSAQARKETGQGEESEEAKGERERKARSESQPRAQEPGPEAHKQQQREPRSGTAEAAGELPSAERVLRMLRAQQQRASDSSQGEQPGEELSEWKPEQGQEQRAAAVSKHPARQHPKSGQKPEGQKQAQQQRRQQQRQAKQAEQEWMQASRHMPAPLSSPPPSSLLGGPTSTTSRQPRTGGGGGHGVTRVVEEQLLSIALREVAMLRAGEQPDQGDGGDRANGAPVQESTRHRRPQAAGVTVGVTAQEVEAQVEALLFAYAHAALSDVQRRRTAVGHVGGDGAGGKASQGPARRAAEEEGGGHKDETHGEEDVLRISVGSKESGGLVMAPSPSPEPQDGRGLVMDWLRGQRQPNVDNQAAQGGGQGHKEKDDEMNEEQQWRQQWRWDAVRLLQGALSPPPNAGIAWQPSEEEGEQEAAQTRESGASGALGRAGVLSRSQQRGRDGEADGVADELLERARYADVQTPTPTPSVTEEAAAGGDEDLVVSEELEMPQPSPVQRKPTEEKRRASANVGVQAQAPTVLQGVLTAMAQGASLHRPLSEGATVDQSPATTPLRSRPSAGRGEGDEQQGVGSEPAEREEAQQREQREQDLVAQRPTQGARAVVPPSHVVEADEQWSVESEPVSPTPPSVSSGLVPGADVFAALVSPTPSSASNPTSSTPQCALRRRDQPLPSEAAAPPSPLRGGVVGGRAGAGDDRRAKRRVFLPTSAAEGPARPTAATGLLDVGFHPLARKDKGTSRGGGSPRAKPGSGAVGASVGLQSDSLSSSGEDEGETSDTAGLVARTGSVTSSFASEACDAGESEGDVDRSVSTSVVSSGEIPEASMAHLRAMLQPQRLGSRAAPVVPSRLGRVVQSQDAAGVYVPPVDEVARNTGGTRRGKQAEVAGRGGGRQEGHGLPQQNQQQRTQTTLLLGRAGIGVLRASPGGRGRGPRKQAGQRSKATVSTQRHRLGEATNKGKRPITGQAEGEEEEEEEEETMETEQEGSGVSGNERGSHVGSLRSDTSGSGSYCRVE